MARISDHTYEMPDGHIGWSGGRTFGHPDRAPRISTSGGKSSLAQPIAYGIERIPSGYGVVETCDFPYCMNPEHMAVVPVEEAKAKKRGAPKIKPIATPGELVSTIPPFPLDFDPDIEWARDFDIGVCAQCDVMSYGDTLDYSAMCSEHGSLVWFYGDVNYGPAEYIGSAWRMAKSGAKRDNYRPLPAEAKYVVPLPGINVLNPGQTYICRHCAYSFQLPGSVSQAYQASTVPCPSCKEPGSWADASQVDVA